MTKTCPGCHLPLPIEVFGLIKKRGQMKPGSRCPECKKAQVKADYAKNREKRRATNREQYKKHKEKRQIYAKTYQLENRSAIQEQRKSVRNKSTLQSWKRRLKLKGLTPEDYDRMLFEQGGVCRICKSPSPSSRKVDSWSVDHCHKTGRVRGLLCNRCNIGIGIFNDDIEILKACIEYLTTSSVSSHPHAGTDLAA